MARSARDGAAPAAAPTPQADQRGAVARVLSLALAVNLSITGVKLAVGLASGSLAVLADAMHSATDALTSLLALVTNGLSDPRPDRDHPYGHEKYEAIGALAIGVFILFTSLEIIKTALGRGLAGLQPIRFGHTELALLLLVIAINSLLAVHQRRCGRRLDSRLLLADARHTSSDVWTSLMVLAGVGGSVLLGRHWLDLAIAVPLCLHLIRVCWRLLRGNLPWLVDQIAIPPEAIHQLALEVPGVLNCHDIASRGVLGTRVFIDMHLVVDADDLPTAHRITELLEERLAARFGPVRCTIHLEPRDYASPQITFRGTHG